MFTANGMKYSLFIKKYFFKIKKNKFLIVALDAYKMRNFIMMNFQKIIISFQ